VKVWSGSSSGPFDVIVVGSGAAGLTAALVAATEGGSVIVLEKSRFFGGTTALSGGMVWIPLNRQMEELGIYDDREQALRYLRALTCGKTSDAMLETLVDRGREALDFLESEGGVRFWALEGFPDYHPEWDGGCDGGRGLEPIPCPEAILGTLAPALRPLEAWAATTRQLEDWRRSRIPIEIDGDLLTRGRALVGPLLRACADRGVTLVTDAAAVRLSHDHGRVTGVVMDEGIEVVAEAGVVLACGGFEWSNEMVERYLTDPIESSCTPSENTGDGIRMAAKVGALLGNMHEAWWQPQVCLPGDIVDGRPRGRSITTERSSPGSIIVDRRGERFVDEGTNYNDITKAFHAFDPAAYGPGHHPAYLVFDHAYLERYGFKGYVAGDPVPEWLACSEDLVALGAAIGVDGDALLRTVARFNEHAARGEDPDFGRGESAYGRYWGDALAPHPSLAPLDTPPFYAIRLLSGVIGTKGGIVTTTDGQALDAFGEPIEGLYAAGNTTAHPMGPGYPGGGGTLGPATTIAYLAGRACMGGRPKEAPAIQDVTATKGDR
jgi:3-oxosteroid 1-dehydrogenase